MLTTEQKVLGSVQKLYMIKKSKFGIYMGSGNYPDLEVLLPNNQVPKDIEKGDTLNVFLYKDSEDRLIATTIMPKIFLYETALLTVKDINNVGAFLDWGLSKDLFLPYKEQTNRVKIGDKVLVALYIDKSNRLCATMKIYDYLYQDSEYQVGDHVSGRVYELSDDFGAFVAVDNTYSALIPKNELIKNLKVGDIINARVKEVREDGKLTLTLQEKIKIQMEKDSSLIFSRLQASGGSLPFHDKTSPEIIKREFGMSKAAFKRAIGRLKKMNLISIHNSGISIKRED